MSKRAIVLVIDRLGASHLGPYGNTLFPTPGFNRLGSTSWLCERAIADAPDLAAAYRAWLTGRHALCPAGEIDLCGRLAERSIGSSLLTDDPEVSEMVAGYGFGEMSELPTFEPTAAAEEIAETQIATFFGALLDAVAELPDSHLLWAHARGLAGPWDAPHDMRQLLMAEDDPEPYAGLESPRGMVATSDEAEHAERWPLVCAHAAHLLVIDACLEALLDTLETAADRETLLVVTAPRGFPLGEHGAVGETGRALYEELLHVPLLVRHPAGQGAAARGTLLAQPADLAATLWAWFAEEPLPDSAGLGAIDLLPHVTGEQQLPPARHRAVAVGEDRSSAVLHTPHWCWQGELGEKQDAEPLDDDSLDDDPAGQLYVKPDDRWEVNEIADRCPEIATAMQAELRQFAELAAAGRLKELPPLAEELREMVG